MRTPSSLRRHRTSAEVPACTTALVTSSLVRTTASSTMSAQAQPQGVADEGSGGRDRSPDGIETGGRARGDHSTPCPVVGVRGPVGDPLLPGQCLVPRRPRILGCLQDAVRWSWCGAPPMPARSFLCHRPGRTSRCGWTAACKVTYLRRPCGCRSPVFPSGEGQSFRSDRCLCFRPDEAVPASGRCADDVRSCRTVMAWFSRGETLGKLQ